MCTGLELAAIAAAGATVGGTVMQNNAMQKSQKAQASATMAELERQKQLRREAEGIFAKSQSKAGQGEYAVDNDKARQQREAQYQSVVSKPEDTGYSPALQGDTPQVIKNEYARAGTAAAASGSREAKARAGIDSFGDSQNLLNIFNIRQGQNLQRTGNFSQWSQQALEPELRAAAAKANSPLGDLLVAIGSQAMKATAGPAMFGPGAAASTIGAQGATAANSAMANGLSSSIVPFTYDNIDTFSPYMR
jgi:hypothetical protein